MSLTWITPVEVTPGSTGWQDADLSSHIAAGATGVILHAVNTDASTGYAFGCRKNGSTDDRAQNLSTNHHFWAACGVDANRICEINVSSTSSIDVYLVGYFGADAVFNTNAVDKSLSSTGSWQDIDLNVNDGAIGAIIEVYSTGTNLAYGLRKNGSTDARTNNARANTTFAFIGVDANEVLEGYIGNAAVDFYVTGYIKSDATFNTNATDLSLGSTGEYADLSALPSGATGGFIEVVCSSAYRYALRKNGTTEDVYQRVRYHNWAAVECDTNRVIEGKIENAGVDFFLVGYTTAASGSTTQKSLTATVNSSASRVLKGKKALSGTVSGAAAIVKDVKKKLTATSKASGTLVKKVFKTLTGSTTTKAGISYGKLFTKALTATVKATGLVVKKGKKVLAGTVNISGIVLKKATKKLTAQSTVQGLITTKASKILTANSIIIGVVVKSAAKKLITAVNLIASLSFRNIMTKALTATVNTAGHITRGIKKILIGTVKPTGSVAKKGKKILVSQTIGLALVVKKGYKTLTASSKASGSVTKKAKKALSAAAQISSSFIAKVTEVGELTTKTLTATVTISSNLAKKVQKRITVTVTAAASRVLKISKRLTASNTIAGSATRAIAKILTATVSATGIAIKRVTKALVANLLTAATFVKVWRTASTYLKTLTATVGVTASIIIPLRRIKRVVQEVVTRILTLTAQERTVTLEETERTVELEVDK